MNVRDVSVICCGGANLRHHGRAASSVTKNNADMRD